MEPHVLTSEELKIQNAVMDKADAIVEAEIEEIMNGQPAGSEEERSAFDVNAAVADVTADPSGKNWKRLFGQGRRSRPVHKRVLYIALNIAVLMVGFAVAGSSIIALYPYAITANDKVICYVDSRGAGTDAVQKAVEDLARHDSDVVLYSTGDDFKIERSFEKTKSETDIKSSAEAADCIAEAVDKNPEKFPEIAVASTRKEIRTFTPEPNYVKNEDAFAGSTVIQEESIDGKKEVTIDYVTVNGEVVKEKEVNEETLDEGRSATIVKGTLGLPDGENWETYEGDPVYRDGEELVKTAMSYIGVARYVKGGTNLKTGVDCVGFVQAIYRLYGVKLSPYLGREGYHVSYANAQPGDILIFPTHVAIYIGNGRLVHAANPRADICTDKVSTIGKVEDVRRIVTR